MAAGGAIVGALALVLFFISRGHRPRRRPQNPPPGGRGSIRQWRWRHAP